jgi:hypothetical protein
LIAVLFSIVYLASCHEVTEIEGKYDWNGKGGDFAWICAEDDYIYGVFGYTGHFWARNRTTHYSGRWSSLGWRHGGQRYRRNKNEVTTGKFWLRINDDDTVTARRWLRGPRATTRAVTFELGEQISDSVSDRITTCGIMDWSSDDTVAGKWQSVDESGNLGDDESVAFDACISGNKYTGSYVYTEGDDDTDGYQKGRCNSKGKVCRSEWSEYPHWGVQLEVLLEGDQLLTLYGTGPGRVQNSNSTLGYYWSDREGTATTAECAANVDEVVNPFKCRLFESVDDCEANPWYCRVRQTDGGCKKRKWRTSAV